MLGHGLDEGCETAGRLLLHLAEPTGGHVSTEDLRQQLGGALERDVLAIHEVDGKGPHPRAPAHRRSGLVRKGAGRLVPAVTTSSLGDVVGSDQHDVGDVEHLADDLASHLASTEILTATPASRWSVPECRARDPSCEVRPGTPGLLALASFTRSCRPCLRPPFSTRLSRGDRVRRRWLGGVLGVATELGLEATDPVMQRLQFRLEFEDACVALLDGELRGGELFGQLLIGGLVIERGSVARRNSQRYARQFSLRGMVGSDVQTT